MSHAFPQVCLASAAPVGAGTSTRLTDAAFLTYRDRGGYRSPIDEAFDSLLVVTQLAVDLSIGWRTQHGLILSSSAVSAAEDYFRSILTEVVSVCPRCEERVQPLETRMEFVFSGSVQDAVRGMLDGESFSSKSNVMTWSKKIAGVDLKNARSLEVLLDEFERICHIRHAAVHAGGYVSTRGAAALGVPSGSWISFGSPAAIHEIVGVIAATLRAYNQVLFESVLTEWLRAGTMLGDWSADGDTFTSLWRAFRSEGDIASSRTAGGATPLRNTAYLAFLALRNAFASRASA